MGIGSAIGGAAQAAGSVASTALQVNAEKEARQQSVQAGDTAAQNISAAGANAQSYYTPYVNGGMNAYNALNGNSAYGQTDYGDTDAANRAYGDAGAAVSQGLSDANQGGALLNNLASGGITQQSIQNLPGYQAQLALGEQGVTNSAAARGLANSGAAEKGAANYATTMAQQGYQNLYQDQLGTSQAYNALAGSQYAGAEGYGQQGAGYLGVNSGAQGNLTNTFDRQNALANYGYQAAGASAQNALNTGIQSNQEMMEGATGGVAATAGIGNALAGGISNLGNTANQYAMYNSLLNGGSSSGVSENEW